MTYWTDWKLIHRNENKMINLLPFVHKHKLRVQKDSTGIQMFLRAQADEKSNL